MRRIFTVVIAFCFLVGCATTKSVSLFQVYSDYNTQVNAENVEALAPAYFSSTLLPTDLSDHALQQQLLFKNLMAEPLQHVELIIGDVGCLAVIGKDSEQFPVQFNLSYRFEADKWLINNVDVLFLEQLTELGRITSCERFLAG